MFPWEIIWKQQNICKIWDHNTKRHQGEDSKSCSTCWVEKSFTSHATIFQSYMWRHRCAGRLKKLYLMSGSQHHRHFAGFFNVPILHQCQTTLFIRWFRHTAPFSGPFYDTLGIWRTYSRLKPPWRPHGSSTWLIWKLKEELANKICCTPLYGVHVNYLKHQKMP